MIPESHSQTLITGVYRSGTEYITQLINCHPQIHATMYRINVLRFIYGKFDPIHNPQNYIKALHSIQDRVQKRYSISLDLEAIIDHLKSLAKVGYGDIYDTVMSSLYLTNGATHWAEKVQLLWREIPDFLSMMPNGKAILIMRDPRSVLCSFKYYTHAPPPAYLGAVFNSLDSMQFAKQHSQDLPENKFLIVKYENVIASRVSELRKIWKFIGMDTKKEYPIDTTSSWMDAYNKPWMSNSSIQPEAKPASFDPVRSQNAWHERLSNAEKQFVYNICGKSMEEFGYTWKSLPNMDIDCSQMVEKDATLKSFYHRWLQTGKGVEAFPQDPLDSKTWNSRWLLFNKTA